ncbi:MAG: SUMF1/EgtB/PvdO family nonheme iron enzyme [Acidobacteriia bacterium]|nr:SUMF1/EgtB/PvdO family nonheme iron enzyme [Terriglobia bacterium]
MKMLIKFFVMALASSCWSQTPTSGTPAQDRLQYDLPGGVKLVLRRVPSGTFQMGGAASDRTNPRRKVTLTRDYYIGETEATQAQWESVMGKKPPGFFDPAGPRFPVGVSRDDVDEFLTRINHLLGLAGESRLRFPTEAEWERAMRAGSQTRFPFGDLRECTDPRVSCTIAEEHAWLDTNSNSKWHEVGLKKPNAYGLFDMLGNVDELVQDWYSDGPWSAVATDPAGPPSPTIGALARGGSWRFGLNSLESRRGPIARFHRSDEVGFRVARSK